MLNGASTSIDLAEHIPLKQGLRQMLPSSFSQLTCKPRRAYSIKTRIKTSVSTENFILLLLAEHIPLKQGLRQYLPSMVNLTVFISQSIFH